MKCSPIFNALVEKVATPAVEGAFPSRVLPSTKSTVPVGMLPSAAEIVAVKLTEFPMSEGFGDEATSLIVVNRTWGPSPDLGSSAHFSGGGRKSNSLRYTGTESRRPI